jgi:5-hydroxyisourate hydrolase-like protein (transthyretin family)
MNLIGMSSLLRAGAATIIATSGLALATAPPAAAGTFYTLGFNYYNVRSNDGWSTTADGAGRGYVTSSMDDSSLTGTWSVNGGRTLFYAPENTTFTFTAPAGTSITGATWTEHALGLEGGDWNVLVSDANHDVYTVVPARDHDLALHRAASGTTLVARLQCGGPGACVALPNAHFSIESTAVTLTDEHAPDPGTPTGSLTGQKLTGVSPITFRANDVGAGVRFVHVYDDANDHVTLIDSNNNVCSDVSNAGLRMYSRRVPCLLSATASATLDTTALADGNHTIKVTLEDAAGNTSTVLGPETKLIANHPPVNTTIPRIDKTEQSFDSYAAPRVGQPITFSSAGTWTGPNLTLEHAWFRCSAGSEHCDQIPGSSDLAYVPTVADVGYTLRLGSTATNVAGTATVYSLPSGEVIAPKSAGDVVDKPTDGANGSNGANGTNGANGAGTSLTLPALPATTTITNNNATTTHNLIGRVVGQEPGVACPGDRATLRFEHVSGSRVHLRFGRSSTAQLELTCTTTGKPVADAKLEIATKTGTQPTVAADVSTDGAGHATIRLAKGASRGITVGYRMYSDDVIARATATLKVLVDGRISIRANRKHLHNGQAVTLRGAVSGGSVPKRGVTLSVQWKDGKRWRPFAQIKTTKNGKYAYAYRFTRTNRTVAYRLRVLIAGGQTDYPYVAVASRSVGVTVGR